MRAGGFLFCVWRLKGFTVCLPPAHNYPVGANIVRPQHDRSLCKERPHIRLTITWEHNVPPLRDDVYRSDSNGKPRQENGADSPPKNFFKKILKKGLTKREFCYILNKSSAMSHQKRQQLNKMESWLSGRRRTIGNRVGVMSVSRVQIPNSPP